MRQLHPQSVIALVLGLLVGAGPVRSAENPVDLSRIERTIAKEPAYRSKAPKYCLVVIGRQAATRLWLVLDDDVLYVDRNGNGDLTDRGERFPEKGGSASLTFQLDEVIEADGKTRHTNLSVICGKESVCVMLTVAGLGWQSADQVRFADRPQDAPIVHFNGPLTPRRYDPEQQAGRGAERLLRGEKPTELAFTLGTPGLGEGTFAGIGNDHVPTDIFPVADIEFPGKAAGDKPIKARVVLTKRC